MTIYRYIGAGAGYHGVPQRDLDDQAFAALTPEQQADVRSGRAYRAEEEPESAPEPAAPPAGEFAYAPPTGEGEPHE